MYKLGVFVDEFYEKHQKEAYQNLLLESLNNPEARKRIYKMSSKRYGSLYSSMYYFNSDLFDHSFWKTLEHERYLYKHPKDNDNMELLMDRSEETRRARKEKINKLLKLAKPLVKIAALLIGISIGGGVVYGFYKLYLSLQKVSAVNLLGNALICVMFIGVVITFYGVVRFININEDGLSRGLKWFFNPIGRCLGSIGRGIVNFCQFIGQMFSDNCPAIVWGNK